jgi:hypothetical protein
MKANTAIRIIDAYRGRRGVFRVFPTATDHGAIYNNDTRLAG